MTREVNILLISDLHYDLSGLDKKQKEKKAQEMNSKLLSALPKKGSDWEPDILIVAGDLVNQNKPEGYHLFFELIESIVARYPNLKDAVFSTPGNHDINRDNIVSGYPYLNGFRKLRPKVEIENSYTDNKIIDSLLTVKKRPIKDGLKLLSAIKRFEQDYFQQYLEKRGELVDRGTINEPLVYAQIEGLHTFYVSFVLGINLVSLNSAFFCNFSLTSNDRNHLFFINDIIKKTLETIPDEGPVVSFMHHPFYYLHESEHIAPSSSESLATDINNNFTKIAYESDLILSGHVHGDLREPTILYQKAYMVTNGTTFTHDTFLNKSYPLTFAILKVNKPLNKFALRRYRYNENSKQFEQQNKAEAANYYDFLRKPYLPRTNNEYDKVMVLLYLMLLPSNQSAVENQDFLIYQLALYDNFFRSKNKSLEIKIKKNPKRILIESGKKMWIVYLVDAKNLIGSIDEYIRLLPNPFSLNTEVYFSIDYRRLAPYGPISKTIVETLIGNYRTRIQSSKKHFININLLYHFS